jgi:hypothetical protein
MFLNSALNLSADPSAIPDGQLLSDVAERLEFNGTWGRVMVLKPRPALGYKGAILLGLHRDDLADVLIVGLFNDPKVVREAWSLAMHAIRWESPVGL